jgi:hypothetical protein
MRSISVTNWLMLDWCSAAISLSWSQNSGSRVIEVRCPRTQTVCLKGDCNRSGGNGRRASPYSRSGIGRRRVPCAACRTDRRSRPQARRARQDYSSRYSEIVAWRRNRCRSCRSVAGLACRSTARRDREFRHRARWARAPKPYKLTSLALRCRDFPGVGLRIS